MGNASPSASVPLATNRSQSGNTEMRVFLPKLRNRVNMTENRDELYTGLWFNEAKKIYKRVARYKVRYQKKMMNSQTTCGKVALNE